MTRRNPYETAVKTAHVTGAILGILVVLAFVVTLCVSAAMSWGWWAFVWVPLGVVVFIVVCVLLGAVGVFFEDVLPRWFHRKRREWDAKHPRQSD